MPAAKRECFGMSLRTAVIGIGHLGKQHARLHAALAQERRSQFISVCDIDAARADEIARQYNVGACADWRTLIGQVDAVSLAVPTESHAEIACGLLEAGCHVLVEQPIARTVAQPESL